MSTEKEYLPKHYVDAAISGFETVPQTDGSIQVTLRLTLPVAQQWHRTPGSTAPLLQDVLEAVGLNGTRGLLRLSPITSTEVITQYDRMEPDGSIRPYNEDEGSW